MNLHPQLKLGHFEQGRGTIAFATPNHRDGLADGI